MTVGKTCIAARESRHEVHSATTTIMTHPLPSVERGGGRGLQEGPKSKEAYKKVTNEGKQVRLFEIRTRKESFLFERS